jgi:hypothetical protein
VHMFNAQVTVNGGVLPGTLFLPGHGAGMHTHGESVWHLPGLPCNTGSCLQQSSLIKLSQARGNVSVNRHKDQQGPTQQAHLPYPEPGTQTQAAVHWNTINTTLCSASAIRLNLPGFEHLCCHRGLTYPTSGGHFVCLFVSQRRKGPNKGGKKLPG